jgi:hypothetical protein
MKKPLRTDIIEFVYSNIFPLLKNKFIKNIFPSLKLFINKTFILSDEIVIRMLQFLNKTWPVRYPDKIVIYLEILETIFENDYIKEKSKTDLLRKVLKKLLGSISDINFLVNFY